MLHRAKPLLIFSHGNSFPASTYGLMLQHLRARNYLVEAVEKFGHDPAYPVTNNWPHLVQELADFAGHHARLRHQPLFLVGHSLGGFLSAMCAALHPILGGAVVQGVVLLDSPLIGGWKANVLRIAKSAGLAERWGPGAVSRQRKIRWPSKDAAFIHFRSKKGFALWDDDAVRHYVEHGTFEHDGFWHLSFDRAIETSIYNTLPDHLQTLLAKHPLQCPLSFIGGKQSLEVKQVGLSLTERITDGRMRSVAGTHLFPIENPLVTAAAIDAEVLNMAALNWDRI